MTQTDQTQVPTAPETTISPEELAAFRAYQARIQRDQRDKELRDTYAQLVDDEIDAATDMLTQLSTDMATIKETVMSNFRSVIDMKTETLGLSKPQGQYTHTPSPTPTAPGASPSATTPSTATETPSRTAYSSSPPTYRA